MVAAVDFPVTDDERTELIDEVNRSAQYMTTEELAGFWSLLRDEEEEALNSLLTEAEDDSMRNTLAAVSAVMAGGLAVSLLLPRPRLHKTNTGEIQAGRRPADWR